MLSWISEHIGGPTAIVFIGTILTALGAVWAARQQTEYEKSLKGKNDEIAELNKKMFNYMSGGGSFCYLSFGIDDAKNTALVSLVHSGEYPVYDISIRIVDIKKRAIVKEFLPATFENMLKAMTLIPIGNLPPHQSIAMGEYKLSDYDKYGYDIFISTRNYFITQIVRLKKIGKQWKQAVIVTRLKSLDTDAELLYKSVDPEFPKDAQGEPLLDL